MEITSSPLGSIHQFVGLWHMTQATTLFATLCR